MARFTNQAQLSYSNGVTNSNVAVGEILEVLSATKVAVDDSYMQYESITYVISLVNSGNTPLTGLTITDNLGSYEWNTATLVPLEYVKDSILYYTNGTLQLTPSVTSESPLTITGISVPANGNAQIIYQVTTNQFAPLDTDGVITNQAIISGGGITAITVTESVNADSEPLLNITKSISPVPVTENGTLTYTFLIQNTGNTAADVSDAIIVSDTFNPILRNLSVTFNGTAWTEGTQYTYNTTTGLFQTVAGAITVPAATYTRDETTGAWLITPGTSTLVISGTV